MSRRRINGVMRPVTLCTLLWSDETSVTWNMTEEQIKEQLSRSFIHLVASRAGLACGRPEHDSGVDLVIRRFKATPNGTGGTRYRDAGQSLDVQLKCTCASSIYPYEGGFRYDLPVKNYNDMVDRQLEPAAPLVVALLVLPDDADSWVSVTPDGLMLRRSAYWYAPPPGAAPTTNRGTIRVDIPDTNVIDLGYLGDLIERHYAA